MSRSDELAEMAKAKLAFRRIRPSELPSGLFSETGWEFILELFVADARGERLTGNMVVARSGANATTASRWLKHLAADGLVVGDGNGDLNDLLTLAPATLAHVEALMKEALRLKEQLLSSV